MDEDDFWGYDDEVMPFEDIIEYEGPNRQNVENEINRLMSRLVRGSTVDVDWSQALCAQKVQEGWDPNIWHCPGDTQPSASAADVCYACPIRLDCLKWACLSGERYGVYAGIPENLRAGKGEGLGRKIRAYDYNSLSLLENVYDVESKKYRYHRSRLREWIPGQEYEGNLDEGIS